MKLTMKWALAGLLCLGSAAPSPHPVKQRILWTWDTWICDYDAAGPQLPRGVQGPHRLDGRHEYTGLVIWGFVDGQHGGEAAAKELARYARSKGIQLLPGVSTDIGAYAGLRRLRARPQGPSLQRRGPGASHGRDKTPGRAEPLLRAGREPRVASSRDRVAARHLRRRRRQPRGDRRRIRCGCADCAERARLQGGPTGGASFSDLGLCVPIVAEVFRRKRPDGLLTYAAYSPLWWKQKPEALEMLKGIPETAAAQWNLELERNEHAAPPVKRNLALLHGGGFAYHLRRREPPAWAFTQYRCFYPKLDDIRRFCGNMRAMKLEGFVVGNVGSPKCPDNELAYLAFIDFSRDPQKTLEAFYRERLPELYGEQAADGRAEALRGAAGDPREGPALLDSL
jgi:hypothetical protein